MSYALSIDLPDTGLTVSALLMSGGAVVQTVALSESGTKPGHYSANGTGAADGKYAVRFEDSGGALKGTGEIEIAGDVEVLVPTATANADALLDRADGVETGRTVRKVLRGMLAAMLGKSSNAGNTFRDSNDTKDRIVAVTDSSGNRTSVTLDLD